MNELKQLNAIQRIGKVKASLGLKIIAQGPPNTFIGELCDLLDQKQQCLTQAEVIGFKDSEVYLMPYKAVALPMGSTVRATGRTLHIRATSDLLGQSVDALARPLHPNCFLSQVSYLNTQNPKINPCDRAPISKKMNTGIPLIDNLFSIGLGQRMGLFASAGLGKSTLLKRLAASPQADVSIIALIGERGREAQEWIDAQQQDPQLKRSILVIACSDECALMRRQAAFTAHSLAEYFAEKGKRVLLLMDSLTRFAMAQREIGLSLGEPPILKGYTPSVFDLLPKLIERSGAFKAAGSISALYSVLLESDEVYDPLSEQIRSFLDGHLLLSKQLAEKTQFPAIDLLKSISRLDQSLLTEEEITLKKQILALQGCYEEHKDFIHLGAYKKGENPLLDEAITKLPALHALLYSNKTNEAAEQLRKILK